MTSLYGQEGRKVVSAERMVYPTNILVDGSLLENVWQTVSPATDFTEYEPDFGRRSRLNTTVRFLYDDYGLYIGLEMQDDNADSIFKDLSVRDETGNADWVAIYLSPACDGQNGFKFLVTAAGVQNDAKIIQDDDDESWDAVWHSKIQIHDSGWVAEILIPWSELRFPNLQEQNWDMNILREVRRYRELSTWQPVDKRKHGFLNQSGTLSGLHNLRSPVRLALMPYGSGYLQKATHQSGVDYTFNAGLDVKYGILNNYTVDITLIPDFGQVKSDDEVYNFSPYEVKYNENRPFFTEGTELFEKAGIFYSRRIGSKPLDYYNIASYLQPGDSILHNPGETQLINATKFSGRNHKGFATGIFNAMTAPTFATVMDSLGNTKELITQPFTNYNMIVVDQTLRNNSFIHLANTLLSHKSYQAGVTAFSGQIKDKKQAYAISGDYAISRQNFKKTSLTSGPGQRYGISISKISGHWRWRGAHSAISESYDPNDMGYLNRNNKSQYYGEAGYYQFSPRRNMLNFHSVLSATYESLYNQKDFSSFNISLRGVTTYRNRLSMGFELSSIPTVINDYFEARVPGRVYQHSGYTFLSIWSSPDYRKTFLTDLTWQSWISHDNTQKGYYLSIRPRLRLSSRAMLTGGLEFDHDIPSRGFVNIFYDQGGETILFGEREIRKMISTLNGSYIISPLSSLSLRVRHYWVTTRFSDFFRLQESGELEHFSHHQNENFTVNFFNIDMVYSWNLRPGSYLQVVYKNALSGNHPGETLTRYIDNWDQMLENNAINSLSVKLILYLDYETIRRKAKKQNI